MAPVSDLGALIASMAPHLDAVVLVYVTVPPGGAAPDAVRDAAVATVREDEGETLVVPRAVADGHDLAHTFPCRRITLRVHSDLAAVGLTAAFSGALAAEGIPANVLAGRHHDHLLVPDAQAELARDVLVDLTAPPALRPAGPDDAEVLWRMLRYAAFAESDEELRGDAYAMRYLDGWQRPDDVGVVAVGPSGRAVGAAWARPIEPGGDHTLALAAVPSQRGRGVGGRLLVAVEDALRAAGVTRLALSVRADNPAVRLYARHGYGGVGTRPNRAGGASLEWHRDL